LKVKNQELVVEESDFLEEVCSVPGGEGVLACIQCGVCSGSCPNVALMDNSPRKTIALIRAGRRDEVLSSNTMWVCLSCYRCTVRCPREVKPTDLMHALETLTIRHKLTNKKTATPIMYRDFVDSIRSYGRVHEFGMMIKFMTKLVWMKKNPLVGLRMLPVALKLLTHGRLALAPKRIKGAKEIKNIVSKVKALGGS